MFKKLPSIIIKLADQTGVRWPGWTSVLIWKVGLIILISISISKFVPLFDEYTNNNVGTQVKVVGHNATIKPPSITFSVPRFDSRLRKIARSILKNETTQNCEECQKMATQSWDVWRDIDFFENATAAEEDVTPIVNSLSALLIGKLSNVGHLDNFNILNQSNFDWNQPLVEAVWNFFACLTQLDADSLDITTTNKKKDQPWCQQQADPFLNDNETLQKLYDRFDRIVSYHIAYRNFSDLTWFQSSQRSSSMAVYNDGFYFVVDIEWNGFDVYISSLDRKNRVMASLNETTGPFRLLADAVSTAWPLRNQIGSSTIFESKENAETVFLTYAIALRVTETRDNVRCHMDSAIVCKSRCMIEKIVQCCQCVPFMFRDRVSSSTVLRPFCNSTHYEQCQINKSGEMIECEQECSLPCEYTQYQWHISRGKPLFEKHRNYFVNFQPLISSFVEFTVTTKDTPEQFFSQVGAIFNFYLGLSGLSLIAFCVFVVDLIKRWYFSKKFIVKLSKNNGTISEVPPDSRRQKLEMATKEEIENLHISWQSIRSELKSDVNELKKTQEAAVAEIKRMLEGSLLAVTDELRRSMKRKQRQKRFVVSKESEEVTL